MLLNEEAFVRSILGDDIEAVTLSIAGQNWQGWERRIDKNWPAHPISLEERDKLETLVTQSCLSCHQQNIRLWCSRTYAIAVPQMPVLDIIDYEGVGTNNSDRDDYTTIEDIRAILGAVFDKCPFEIIFADAGGLEAVFLQPVEQQQALDLQEIIECIPRFGSSFNLMYSQLNLSEEEKITANLDFVVADYILRNQTLSLYWD